MLGSSWRDWVPFNWTLPSFDWSHLGEFGECAQRWCMGGGPAHPSPTHRLALLPGPPAVQYAQLFPRSIPVDYGSNLGDFLDAQSLKNMTNIHSVKDLANSWEEIEAAFCDKEE